MRRFPALLLVATAFAQPAFADVSRVQSHVTAVTVFPQGAQVTREVDFTAQAGTHELLIADLPATTQADLIRLRSSDVSLGAFALRSDRLPPRTDTDKPDYITATKRVEAAEAASYKAQAAIDAINAQIEAAQAQVSFLAKAVPEGGSLNVKSLTTLVETIGAQTLMARQAALAAAGDLPAAQKSLDDAQTALAEAEATREALSQSGTSYAALSVAYTAETAGPQHLTVTHFVPEATWAPVYDITLDRPTASLKIARSVLVSQFSGEDWAGVDLTLSTAQPSSRSAPSTLYPQLREVYDPKAQAEDRFVTMSAPIADAVGAEAPAPSMMRKEIAAVAENRGQTVIYTYPAAVSVATGVENLRLALDELDFTAKTEARAVPARDETAYLMATFRNQSTEILLPGAAYLYRDGGMIGGSYFEGLAPAAETEMAFGPIEGLRLKRTMPERTTGDRGFISTSTEQEETAILSVENLTDEAWPLHVLDQVPYSEQAELKISYSATPAASAENYKDQRGVLSWEFSLPAGKTQEITLTQKLNWPEGKVLN